MPNLSRARRLEQKGILSNFKTLFNPTLYVLDPGYMASTL